MEEQLITFETAKYAKDKGFDQYSKKYYSENGTRFHDEVYRSDKSIEIHGLLRCYANPQSILQKWLREDHGIHIWVTPRFTVGISYKCTIETEELIPENLGYFDTYEEALEKALQESLNQIEPIKTI